VCIVDAKGKIFREAKVASEPGALIRWLKSQGVDLARIGLETGPLSQWLYAAMKAADLQVELLETRHVRDAFRSRPTARTRAALPS
jgi:transposase